MYLKSYYPIDINKVIKKKKIKKKTRDDILFEKEEQKIKIFYRLYDRHFTRLKEFKEIWNLPYGYSPLMVY